MIGTDTGDAVKRCQTVHIGDARAYLEAVDPGSFSACVTDPPYGLGFMRKQWDRGDGAQIAFDPSFWALVLRALKPGAHLLAFGGTRCAHRMVTAIEDAGFEIRDSIAWLYGSGFPKSVNVSKATDDAKAWQGYGTALKPAHEPICVARKPLDGTIAATALRHGTAALNIDGCRVPGGRWPANVIVDPDASRVLDQQSGINASTIGKRRGAAHGAGWGMTATGAEYNDIGGASRFFYVPKASTAERETGCDLLPAAAWSDGRKGTADHPKLRDRRERKNSHVSVKPVDLMRYLVRLVKTPGDPVILDPFAGSGTTGVAAALEGVQFVGCEMDPAYAAIARARIAAAGDGAWRVSDGRALPSGNDARQIGLFGGKNA